VRLLLVIALLQLEQDLHRAIRVASVTYCNYYRNLGRQPLKAAETTLALRRN